MKKLINFLLCLTLFSCGGSGGASANSCNEKDCPIGIKIIHVEHELAFDFQAAERIAKLGIEFLNANTTSTYYYAGGISMPDPNPNTATLNNFLSTQKRFRDFSNMLFKNPGIGGNYRGRELTMVIDRPLLDENGVWYTAGRANICALYEHGSIGISYLTPFTNPRPQSGSYQKTFEEMIFRGANNFAHEASHLSGAFHKDEKFEIMLPYPIPEVHDGLLGLFYVNSESNREIEVCFRRETRRKILRCRSTLRLRRCKKRARIKKIRLRDVKHRENRRSLTEDHVGCYLEKT